MNAKSEHRWNDVAIPPAMDDHVVSRHLSLFWDGGDPWGSAMAEGFALCDFLAGYLGAWELIPADMGYRMAMGGPEEEDPIYQELVYCYAAGYLNGVDCAEYLAIVGAFLDQLRADGWDY